MRAKSDDTIQSIIMLFAVLFFLGLIISEVTTHHKGLKKEWRMYNELAEVDLTFEQWRSMSDEELAAWLNKKAP